MPTISKIQAIPFRLPLSSPLKWGSASQMETADHVLVRVITDNGDVGLAEAVARPTIYGETVASIQAIINQHLAPMLLGQPLTVESVRSLSQRMALIANNQTAKGALDIGLHDALAASHGQHLLDAWPPTQTRVKVSYILGISDLESSLREAQSVYEQGVRVFKVKVGRDMAAELALLDALQQTFGNTVTLYVDANEGLSLNEVTTQMQQLAEAGVLYIEEPLPVTLLNERRSLCERNILPIIADDSAMTLPDLVRELQFRTFDILNIKTARTGYSQSQAMLALATQHGKGVMVGSQASSGLGTVRAAIFAGQAGVSHPSELSFFLKLREDIVNQPIQIVDGFIELATLRDIAVDEAKLTEFRLS